MSNQPKSFNWKSKKDISTSILERKKSPYPLIVVPLHHSTMENVPDFPGDANLIQGKKRKDTVTRTSSFGSTSSIQWRTMKKKKNKEEMKQRSRRDPSEISTEPIDDKPATAKYPVCADGLRKVLKYIKENNKYREIMVTENGYKETLGEKDVLPDALSDSNRKYYHETSHGITWSSLGGNDYPGDDMSGAQSVTRSSLMSSRMVFH